MVRSITKKMLALMIIVVCIAGMAFSVSANSRKTGTYSGYSGQTTTSNASQVNSGACYHYYLKLNSVSYNSLPSGTFPNSSSYVRLSIYKGGSEKGGYNFYNTNTAYNGTYSPTQYSGTYNLGRSSNVNLDFTVGATWNGQEVY